MRKTRDSLRSASLLALILLATISLMPSHTARAQITQIPRAEALYMESWEDPSSFNPYNPDAPPFLPFLEPLFVFDSWHFTMVPWLAESGQWVDDLTFKVRLHDGTMWNDGQSLTTADVDYTYTLPLRRNEITGVSADLWEYLERITVIDSSTIDFVLKAENPNKYILMYSLSNVYIQPQHVWSTAETQYEVLTEFSNMENPVGSGPYKFVYASVSERRTVWIRDDNYWGEPYFGLPQPKYIVNIVSTSNEVANMAFERGELDWSENFMPNIWEMWETKHLARGTWSTDKPYYMPVPYMTGYITFNYLKIPENDALTNSEFRRAMAFAIDFNTVCDIAFSKLTIPANPSLLPENIPEVAKYINTTAVQQYGWTYNVARANEILDNLGYAMGNDDWRHYQDGAKLGPYDLLIVEGWTDWEAAAEIVRENLADVGIDITVRLVDDVTFFHEQQFGDYIMTFDQPSSWTASSPWYQYYVIYFSRTSPAANAPMPAFGNWGSYNNTRVDELIDEMARTSPEDEERLTAVYGELQSIILRELPYIPGWFYGPFYMYSTTYWTNWPNEDNAYSGGVPYWDTGRGWYPMLFGLKSTSAPGPPIVPTEILQAINQSITSLQDTVSSLQQDLSSLQSTVSSLQSTVYISVGVSVIAIIIAVIAILRARRVED